MKFTLTTLLLVLLFASTTWGAKDCKKIDPKLVAEFYITNCADCHGENGEGHEEFSPKLKGESVQFFMKSIKDFKKNLRTGDSDHREYVVELFGSWKKRRLAEALGKYLEGEDWYTTGPFPTMPTSKNPAKYYKKNCSRCHGKDGEGTISGNRVRGQWADYSILQIEKYISEERPDRMMHFYLKDFKEDKQLLEDVAKYMQAGEGL